MNGQPPSSVRSPPPEVALDDHGTARRSSAPIKFYQTGTFTVGNRLLAPEQRSEQSSIERNNSLNSYIFPHAGTWTVQLYDVTDPDNEVAKTTAAEVVVA